MLWPAASEHIRSLSRASLLPLDMDDYEDYLPVGSPSELFGEGGRIYTAPTEDAITLPPPMVALGDPHPSSIHLFQPTGVPTLRIVKCSERHSSPPQIDRHR